MGEHDRRRDGNDESDSGATGGSARAPGKRTRTSGMAPKPKGGDAEIEMTGIPALDNDKSQDGGSGFHLTNHQRDTLRNLVQAGIGFWIDAVMAALSNAKLAKATKNDHFWNGFLEVLFLSVTGPLVGPIAGALARSISKMSMPIAELGLHRAAWAMAMSPKDLIGPVTIAFKGVRGQLAHADGRPKDLNAQMAFLSEMQSRMGPAAMQMVEGISQLPGDDELIAYYWVFKDPDVFDVSAHGARINKLLDMFEANRLGSIGDEMDLHGGLKTAEPKKIIWRNKEYIVLLESFGVHNSALALNGANLNQAKPKASMESLVYVRMIEQPMWGLVTAEYAAKMGQTGLIQHPSPNIETLNLNDKSVRSQHRWVEDWSCPYSCVEAGFLGPRKRRGSLLVATPRRTP